MNMEVTKSRSSTRTTDVDVNAIDFDELDDYLERFQEDDEIKQALDQGVDLRAYARNIDSELREAEADAVTQYVKHSSDIVSLHDEVQSCDNLLAKMQELLLGFQADLGGISDEIRQLQDESVSMNVRLHNRRDAEAKLDHFLTEVALPPSLVQTIDQGELDETFLHALVTLNGKLQYAALREPDPKGSSLDIVPSKTRALIDVRSNLDNLCAKAVNKSKGFLLTKISELTRPKTNVQMLQQHVLLPVQYMVQFLSEHAPKTEQEVREFYAESMSKTLLNVFKAYHAGLLRHQEDVATKNDLLVVDAQTLQSGATTSTSLFFGTNRSRSPRATSNGSPVNSQSGSRSRRSNPFDSSGRDDILDDPASPPVILHVAQQEDLRLPYEQIFRHVQQHLLNSATSEYLFLSDFFRPSNAASIHGASDRTHDLFLRIFAKTLSLCLENLENYLFNCHDAVALLLMARITRAQRLVMEKRRLACLDSYFDRVALLIWPRYKLVLDAHLKSIKSANVKKLGQIDLHPHYVSRRYATFVSSVLHITSTSRRASVDEDESLEDAWQEDGSHDMIVNNLRQLREAMMTLLIKMADHQYRRNARERSVFLINNYDFILTSLRPSNVSSDDQSAFEDLLGMERERFVEEELQVWFSKLIHFVHQWESAGADTSNMQAREVEVIMREFDQTWKSAISKMNDDSMNYFSNLRNGTEVLKQVLTQLLLYYTRFMELTKSGPSDLSAFEDAVVTTQEMLQEIKKYNRSI